MEQMQGLEVGLSVGVEGTRLQRGHIFMTMHAINARPRHGKCTIEMNRIHLILFDMSNRIFGAYLAPSWQARWATTMAG
jgi:hypothetical protein